MFNKKEYDMKYAKENYHHMNLQMPKEYKKIIQEAAEKKRVSRNKLVIMAIDEYVKRL